MKIKSMSRAQLFLIELIIVILFFTLTGAVTLQVFVKASEQADHAQALNGGMMAVQNAAEADKSKSFTELSLHDTTVYYTDKWQNTNGSKSKYVLTSRVDLEERWVGVMASFTYTVKEGNKVIFQLKTKKYYSGEVLLSADGNGGDTNE